MGLKIKPKNMRRLASLSALGPGVLALSTGTAEADIVHVDVDQTISPFQTNGIFLPGGNGIGFNDRANSRLDRTTFGTVVLQSARVIELNAGTRLQAAAFSTGGRSIGVPTFGGGRTAGVAFRTFSLGLTFFGRPMPRRDSENFFPEPYRYFLFQFPDNGKTLFRVGTTGCLGKPLLWSGCDLRGLCLRHNGSAHPTGPDGRP